MRVWPRAAPAHKIPPYAGGETRPESSLRTITELAKYPVKYTTTGLRGSLKTTPFLPPKQKVANPLGWG